jgi:hypothetical protein
MRDGEFNGQPFPVQVTPGGDQKGLQTILTERGMWPQCMHLNVDCHQCHKDNQDNGRCCLKKVVSLLPDFKRQEWWLREVGRPCGATVINYPRYHCD